MNIGMRKTQKNQPFSKIHSNYSNIPTHITHYMRVVNFRIFAKFQQKYKVCIFKKVGRVGRNFENR